MIKTLKKTLFNYHYNIKLKNKLIFSHLILAIIPALVLFILLYSQFSKIILSNTLHNEQSLSLQTKEKLEFTMNEIHKTIDSITINPFIKNLNLSQNAEDTAQFEKIQTLKFLNEVDSLLTEDSNVSNIKIYVDKSLDGLIEEQPSHHDIFEPMIDIQPSYWHGIFSSQNISHLVCPSLYLTPSERATYGEFAIVYKVPYIDSNKPAMYIAAYFSKDTIDSVLNENIQFVNSVTYLVDNRDTLVSSTDPILVGRYLLKYKDVPEYIGTISTFTSKARGFERIYISYNKIQDTNWYMISAVSANDILSEGRITLFRILLFYIVIIIIVLYTAIWLSNTIVKRIYSIIKQMSLVRTATPKKLNEHHGDDEIGDLIDTYNYMVSRINNLLKEQEKTGEELRKSELKALQSQINPHFLYNTLDMISWLSNKEDHEKVETAIQSLSKFYKLTLNKGNTTVTLREELNHVSLYVKLQNMRFEENIHFIIDIPDELLDYEIPSLVLQPVVENSILHGILAKESKEGSIIIMGWIEDDMIVLTVSDDGIGMSEEMLNDIIKGKGKHSSGSNVAVYNTHRRLQLFYNHNFGLTYRSEKGKGTEVEINIPANIINKD